MASIPRAEDPAQLRERILETYGELFRPLNVIDFPCFIEIAPLSETQETPERFLITPSGIIEISSDNPNQIWNIPEELLEDFAFQVEVLLSENQNQRISPCRGFNQYQYFIKSFSSLIGNSYESTISKLDARLSPL